MVGLLPHPHFDLNRYSPVKAVRNRRNHTDIGAEGLALDRQQRQRRNKPPAVAVVRIAIKCANGDASAKAAAELLRSSAMVK